MANVAKIAINFRLGDPHVTAVCVLHVKTADGRDPMDETDLTDIGLAVFEWWTNGASAGGVDWPAGKANYTENCVLHRIQVRRIAPTTSEEVIQPGEDTPGDLPANYSAVGLHLINVPFPPQVCWMVGLRTSRDDRSGKGRIYLPAEYHDYRGVDIVDEPSRAQTGSGELSFTQKKYAGQLVGLMHYRLRHVTATEGEFQWAVWSPTVGEAYTVQSFKISNWHRTQRRRARHPGDWTATGLDGVVDEE